MTTAVHEVQTITVERLELEQAGSTGGKPWSRYVVHGTDEFGQPLHDCKTFDNLPSGTVKVVFEPYMKDGVRQSWTLKPLIKKARGARPVGGDLEARVAQLESEVTSLRSKLDAILRGLRDD